MFKRTSSLALAVVAIGGIGMLTSKQAHSQLGVFKNDVGLQSTTPGTTQSGHSNISGTSRAGAFVGGAFTGPGTGLTGLNASNLSVGTVADARLSSNVALRNAANTFSAPNTFNDLTIFNNRVGINTGIFASPETRFQVNDPSATNYGGMYVSTTNPTAWPFYGYAPGGVFRSWTYYNGGDDHWKLNMGTVDRLAVSQTGKFAFNSTITQPTDLTYVFNTSSLSTDGLYVRNALANSNAQLFLDGGGNFGSITMLNSNDILQIENDSAKLYMLEFGYFGINTLTPTGSEDLTIESRNPGGYGGAVVRVNNATNGQPFYGYSNGSDYMWTYFDSGTDEFRIFNAGDRFRLASNGSIGLQTAPVSDANVLSETLSSSGSKDGIRSFAAGSLSPFAVWGATTSATGTGIGVHGSEVSTNASAFGVFATGNMGATGTKSFMIDHPLDPTNAYLKHYSTESPTPQNTYNGSIVTDGSGIAWVNLPDYFSEINVNFRYQLTVVDESEDFVMAKVSRRIAGNRFQIRTSKPNVEVSWQVTADRNDKYVQREGAPDVVEKPDMFKGTYLDPLSWGVPAEQGQEYRRAKLAKAEAEREARTAKPQDWRKLQQPPAKRPATRDRR